MIDKQLKAFKEISIYARDVVLGGSIGLFLHGHILNRTWSDCDLDLTYPDVFPNLDNIGVIKKEMGESADMDHNLIVGGVKVQVQDLVPCTYITIIYEGNFYRVRTFIDILNWKLKYANEGWPKHIEDIKNMGFEKLLNPVKIDF